MNVDLKELEKDKQKNKKERVDFIKFWVNYIKENPDEVWSEQQNLLINSQFS